MKTFRALLASRKFVAAFLGVLGAIGARLGLPQEHASAVAEMIVLLAAVYVGGTALEDAAEKRSVRTLTKKVE